MTVIKLLMMIRYVAIKEVTIQALGADHKNEELDAEAGRQHFNRVFQYIKDTEASRKQRVPEYTRIIGNEVVGKELKPSVSVERLAINPASACPHPNKDMMRRGNAKEQRDGSKIFKLWWTCKLCHSRWERYALPAPQVEGTPKDSDTILFGQFLGQTYLEVYNNHPSYCSWVVETAEWGEAPSQHLLHFNKYLLFHAPADSPESIRIKQQEAREQAFGPLNPERYPQRPSETGAYMVDPTQYSRLGRTPQQVADAQAFAGTEWEHVPPTATGPPCVNHGPLTHQPMEISAADHQAMLLAEYEHRASCHVGMIDDDKDL